MTAMMIVFIAGFVNGFLSATLPTVTQSGLFIAAFTAITCLASGQFLGRALKTLQTPVTKTA